MILSRSPRRLFLGFWRKGFMGVCLAGMWCGAVGAEPEQEAFSFPEIYELLKANLAGTTEAELNQAAVRGLLDQLAAKVTVVGEPSRVSGQPFTNAPITATLICDERGTARWYVLAPGAAVAS